MSTGGVRAGCGGYTGGLGLSSGRESRASGFNLKREPISPQTLPDQTTTTYPYNPFQHTCPAYVLYPECNLIFHFDESGNIIPMRLALVLGISHVYSFRDSFIQRCSEDLGVLTVGCILQQKSLKSSPT